MFKMDLGQKFKILRRPRSLQILIKIHWIDAFSYKNKYLIIKKWHSILRIKILHIKVDYWG